MVLHSNGCHSRRVLSFRSRRSPIVTKRRLSGNNTLNQFADLGMVRRVSVDGCKTYFDTNMSDHHHVYFENRHELIEIPASLVQLGELPERPEGYEVSRIDVMVRLRR